MFLGPTHGTFKQKTEVYNGQFRFQYFKTAVWKKLVKRLGVVAEICTRFEQEAEIHDNKDFHIFYSFKKDLTTIVEKLHNLFDNSNPKILILYKKSPIVQSINLNKLTTWVVEKIINLNFGNT